MKAPSLRTALAVILTIVSAMLVPATAQELNVRSIGFEAPLRRVDERPDLNGEACALLKVHYPYAGLVFEGAKVGDVTYSKGEYRVYYVDGTYMLQIRGDGVYPLFINTKEYGLDKMTGGMSYKLVLGGVPAQAVAPPQPAAPAAQPVAEERPRGREEASRTSAPQTVVNEGGGNLKGGKDAIKAYEAILRRKMTGQKVSSDECATHLLNAFNALYPLLGGGSKQSREAAKILVGHMADFGNVAVELYSDKGYDKAFLCFDAVTRLADRADVRSQKEYPSYFESLIPGYYFNKGVSAWQAKRKKEALEALKEAIARGYEDKRKAYEFALAIAYESHDSRELEALGLEGLDDFGGEWPELIGYAINDCLARKDYDHADYLVDKALARHPGVGQYYGYRGVVYESRPDFDHDTAIAIYRSGLDRDAGNELCLMGVARNLCSKAYALGDKAPTGKPPTVVIFNPPYGLYLWRPSRCWRLSWRKILRTRMRRNILKT